MYDSKNKVVFVRNFLQYNGKGRPDLVLKSVYNDFKYTPTPLWEEFARRYVLFHENLLSLIKVLEKASIPIPNPMLTPMPVAIPTPTARLTHTKKLDASTNKAPVDEMRKIFLEYWEERNQGPYIPDDEREIVVAARLYTWCLEAKPDKPLEVFSERVENLVRIHKIKQFTGLLKYWNAGDT